MQYQIIFATAFLAALKLSSMVPVNTPNAAEHSKMDEDSFMSLMEQGGHYQGDILNSKEELEAMFMPGSGIRNESYRWPKNKVIYKISRKMTANQTKSFENAMALITKKTKNCIKFQKRTNEADYVNVIDGKGCSSAVGRRGNVQELTLNNSCFSSNTSSVGVIAHELIHAIGFEHEQARSDRDEYVTIHLENVDNITLHGHNFNKYNTTYTNDFGVPYDLDSIMHYGLYFFSKDKKKLKTITINRGVNPKNITPGYRDDLSDFDVAKIRKMYKCKTISLVA